MPEAVADVVSSAVESMDSPLFKSDLNSLGAVESRNSLAGRFGVGVELPATVTLDYPSFSVLAHYLSPASWPPPAVARSRGGGADLRGSLSTSRERSACTQVIIV